MIDVQFLADFKMATEKKWSVQPLKDEIYGFQIRPGTRWNNGLSETAISEYERAVGFSFQEEFKMFLRAMNGTDLPTVNVYGRSGHPTRESVGVYSYPRDLAIVKGRIEAVHPWRRELVATMAEQGFDLPEKANLMPIYAHRYLVCIPGGESSVVLSIWDGSDAIVYGQSLSAYLQREFLGSRT